MAIRARFPRASSLLIAAAFAALSCATGGGGGTNASPLAEEASFEAVIDAVKAALVEAESSEAPGLPPLKTVSVKLQTGVARSAGGELRLIVFSAGSSVAKEATSTIEVELQPPGRVGRRSLLPGEVREALARAIVLAKTGAARATRGDPPLAVKAVNVDLRFSVSVDGSAAGSVRLTPVGLEASGKISHDTVHTISLTFAP